MDMIKHVGTDGAVTYTQAADQGSFISAPIDAVTQILDGEPVSAKEAGMLTLVAGVVAYGFGHHMGYKDRDAGKPKKLLGLI